VENEAREPRGATWRGHDATTDPRKRPGLASEHTVRLINDSIYQVRTQLS